MSENTKNNNPSVAVGIDIGSNSIRMLIAKVHNGKIIEMLASERATTRLASGIKTTGLLSEKSLNASLDVLNNFKQIIDKFSADKIKAFATSAVREAKNGNTFIDEVRKIGIPIEIISGITEANLVYKGVNTGLDIGEYPLIFDTGGGSTEFIAAQNGDIIFAESYKIGVVKLVDQFDMKDNALSSIPSCKDFVSNFFKDIVLPKNCATLIATAGTATTVAAIHMKMKQYDWRLINGYKVNKIDIERLLYQIASTPYSERIKIPGMEKGREDLIIPGIIIILEIMSKTGFQELTISDFGLREGAVVFAAGC